MTAGEDLRRNPGVPIAAAVVAVGIGKVLVTKSALDTVSGLFRRKPSTPPPTDPQNTPVLEDESTPAPIAPAVLPPAPPALLGSRDRPPSRSYGVLIQYDEDGSYQWVGRKVAARGVWSPGLRPRGDRLLGKTFRVVEDPNPSRQTSSSPEPEQPATPTSPSASTAPRNDGGSWLDQLKDFDFKRLGRVPVPTDEKAVSELGRLTGEGFKKAVEGSLEGGIQAGGAAFSFFGGLFGGGEKTERAAQRAEKTVRTALFEENLFRKERREDFKRGLKEIFG